MKCPICHGTGIEKIYDKRTNAYFYIPCATCHKTGHINQTNEDWLKSLDTEDFAKEITNIEKLAKIEQIEWWLKQPHTRE